MLFVLANLARKLGSDAETSLTGANAKFIRRFGHIEASLAAQGKSPRDSSLEEMDQLWNAAGRRPDYEQFARGLCALPQRLLAAPQKRSPLLAREGQSPSAMVIACADSRVAPELIFDCVPGEIFVARNVSNLVPPYAPDAANHGTSAALEFAVTALNVRTIVVLGHSGCGGIRALMQGPGGDHGDFIASWMAIAGEARRRVCDALMQQAWISTRSAAAASMNRSASPWPTYDLPVDPLTGGRGPPDADGHAFHRAYRPRGDRRIRKKEPLFEKSGAKTC